MTSRGRRGGWWRGWSRRARGASLGVGLAVLALACGVASPCAAQTAPAKAPSAEELRAARELFQEAYKDEQERRFAQALDKFQRVAAVKESASVRYRIGSVLESLGRLREARDAFRALAASKSNLPANEQEIADSAAERAHQLDRKIPRLVLKLQDNAPPDARVTVDGASVPASTTPRPFELDPGEHLVQATSPSSRPSESKVTLLEGDEVTVSVVLEPLKGKPKPPPARVTVQEPPEGAAPRDDTLAYIALGAGGALLVTGIVLLAVREGDISELEKECGSDNVCPAGKKADLEATRDQAQLFGPLGVGLGLVGLAGIGVGGWLLLRPSPPTAMNPATRTTTSAPTRGLRIAPRPVVGGAVLGLSTAF